MFFNRKKEKKSFSSANWFFDLMSGNRFSAVNHQEFIDFYIQACPVFTATKLIADAVSSIEIILRDKNTGAIIPQKTLHPSLAILRKPNPFTDGKLFLKEISSFDILTGNFFVEIVKSSDGKNILELNVVNPKNISIDAATDGFAEYYRYQGALKLIVFERQSDKRFISPEGNEIIHLREFNPNFSSSNLWGASAFLGCQLEIMQYIAASVHNHALLKNGARPSGMMTYEGDDGLSQEQADAIRKGIKDKLSGATNAGEPMFLSGKFKWQQLSESVKDMDFGGLKKATSEAIYSAVKIPLPMVSPDNMSFANMDASKYLFYDNAVLPVFKRILSFLTEKLLSQYKDAVNWEYSFDESAIEALEARKYENAKVAATLGILSDNELRSIIGYEKITAGDAIYKPANLVPIGQDTYTADNRESPKKEFFRIMEEQKNLDGSRQYNDEYIQLKAKEFYGD